MARTARVKYTGTGTAHYHLMSRTNDKRFLFGKGVVKTALVDALKRAAAFSGIELKAYVAMDNHFHVVCKVTRTDEPVPEDEILRRVAILKGRKKADELAEHWKILRCAGLLEALETSQNAVRRRMNDVSEMIKTFKEEFDRRYKKSCRYYGSVWSGRFKSTLIEDGRYLEICKRYVRINPVRAGIVGQVKDYPWSWCETEVSSGPVPDGRLMRHIAQIGEGKVFGSEAFVRKCVFGLGDRFKARHVGVHEVGEIGFSSHGWLLAKREAA